MPETDSPTYTAGGTYKPSPIDRLQSLLPSRAPSIDLIQASYPVAMTDISVWQGKTDFTLMRQLAQALYIRAGYGNDGLDSYGEINAAGARAAGMEWGLYWFVKPGKDFKKHIESFKAVYQAYGGKLPPVFDCEYTEYTTNIRNNTTNWLTKLVKNWQEATGIDPMIYTRASWWDANTYRTDWPKQLDLWTAHYTSAGSPAIPKDWGAVANPRTWVLWQWSADGNGQGAAHGVSSYSIDRNRFQGSIQDFNSKYKTDIKPIGEPPPPPPPPPVNDTIKPIYRIKVTANALNVRAGPSVEYSDLGDLTKDNVLPVVEENGDWVRVEGYVSKKFVTKL